MKSIKFTIYGEPMGKQRPRFSRVGDFVKTHSTKETINYESKVVFSFKQQQEKDNFQMFDASDEIVAHIVAYFKIPKSCYRFHKKTNTTDLTKDGQLMSEGRINPKKKPDCDNIAKICLDALNGIAYYDDSQIVSLVVEKRYSSEPRVEIRLVRNNNEAL